MNYIRYVIILVLLSFFMKGHASHIIGGDLQYRCIGNDRYEITLIFIRDCENANPEANIDVPAIVSFYDENYKPLLTVGGPGSIGHIKMFNYVTDTLYDVLDDPCFPTGGHLCVEETIYKDTVRLPPRPGGYRLAYQRCCRNVIVQNIIEPIYTGATYELYITEESLNACNTGPQLTYIPKLYTCVGEQFQFDQSYEILEGDSIVYSICRPNAGASYSNPIPGIHPPGPFPKIEWAQGYSTLDMLNNPDDPVTISQDGIITGTPLNTGTYLIGFCIEEYRNGVLLSSSNRDFEVTVLPCGEISTAEMDIPDLICDGNTEVKFINNSVGADNYRWFFDMRDTTITSSEFEPTYTYPALGCYDVMLVVTADSICYDTARQEICIYEDGLSPDFTYTNFKNCTDTLGFYFYNTSTDTVSTIAKADWEIIFGNDTTYISGDTIFHLFPEEGTAKVTLTVTDERGCAASISDNDVNISDFCLKLVGDSLEICIGDSTPLIEGADPAYTYTYVPETDLDLSEQHNPIASPDSNITYVITMSDGIRSVTDSVHITVLGMDFTIVNLSDSCDVYKTLTTNNTTHTGIIWSTDPSFSVVKGMGDTLDIRISEITTTVYVMLQDTLINCLLKSSFTLEHKGLLLDYPDLVQACQGEEKVITLKNLSDLDYEITWEDNPIIISNLNDTTVTILPTEIGEDYLVFFAEAENGCTLRDTVFIEVNESVHVDFAYTNECGSLKVEFFNLSDSVNMSWDFGDGKTSSIFSPTHIYDEPGTYTVTLTGRNGCIKTIEKTITIDEYDVHIGDEVISCDGEATELNPGGNEDLTYHWEPSTGLDDPDSFNPVATGVIDTTMYYVTITDSNTDCETIDSVLLIPRVAAVVDFAYANECGSLTVDFTNLSDTSEVMWDFGDGQTSDEENPSHTYRAPGTYTITLSVDDGCGSQSSYTITIDEYEIDILDQVSSCFGDPVELNPGGNPDLNYNWEPTEGLDDPTSYNPIASITDSTMYYVTITDDDTDCQSIDSILVIPVDTFIISTSDDVFVCTQDTVTISASSSEGSIKWYDANGFNAGSGPEINIVPGHSPYYIAVAEHLGCFVSDTVFVKLYNLGDLIEVTADPETIDFEETSQLDVVGGTSDYTYTWRPSDGLDNASKKNPIAKPKETTEYCVTVVDENGCDAEMCVRVEVREPPCREPYIFLPNAFTPNGDGNNDILYMRGEAITELELMIYNRWGEEVFHTTDKNIGWDGTDKNGKVMPTDVYGYYYKVGCGDGGTLVKKGNVSLLR